MDFGTKVLDNHFSADSGEYVNDAPTLVPNSFTDMNKGPTLAVWSLRGIEELCKGATACSSVTGSSRSS